MSGVWRRSYGLAIEAPPDERGGNRQAIPNATAPHLDSTNSTLSSIAISRPLCSNSVEAILQTFSLGPGRLTCSVRHEVARVFIKDDPVFCRRDRTGTCVGGNPGVRSSRDNVASVHSDWQLNREGTLRLPAS